MSETEIVKCAICRQPIEGDDLDKVEDFLCVGCGAYICGDHLNAPFGEHQPEEHDLEDPA